METNSPSQLQLHPSEEVLADLPLRAGARKPTKSQDLAIVAEARHLAKHHASLAGKELSQRFNLQLEAQGAETLASITSAAQLFTDELAKVQSALLLTNVAFDRFRVLVERRTFTGRCYSAWRSVAGYLMELGVMQPRLMETDAEMALRSVEAELAMRSKPLRRASIDGPGVLAIANTLAQSDEARDHPDRQAQFTPSARDGESLAPISG